jgi:hypothetical protein
MPAPGVVRSDVDDYASFMKLRRFPMLPVSSGAQAAQIPLEVLHHVVAMASEGAGCADEELEQEIAAWLRLSGVGHCWWFL